MSLKAWLSPVTSIDSKLSKDEAIILRTKCHWAVFLGPVVVVIIGGLACPAQGFHAIALMTFGVAWGIFSYFSSHRSEIGLTEKRVLVNAGFPLVKFYNIALNKIAHIDFYQPSLGSMLDFGNVTIVYNGGDRCVIRSVSSPAGLVSAVRQQVYSCRP